MTARDVFGAGCRLLGLYLLQLGIFDLCQGVSKIAGLPMLVRYTPAEDMIDAIVLSAIGLFFMLRADMISRFLYERKNSN
ncbi:hypothetical protein ABC974_06675 [Sphingomonas oligophenolica]|uniref:DUF1622 domain-containing protein n=1 Tax=Sphingomonas oligophenolica TaxID=301154 RepID=A0ABU9Y0F8_9SPHN